MIRGAVLGSPISHSLSPTLHSSAYQFLGIEGEYSAQEVPAGSLNSFISSQGDNFDYLSLTMPLKEEVLSLEVECDDLTRRIQSGNTLVRANDAWKLTSTDGSGFVSALLHRGITKISSVLILGAGGTARAVAGALDSLAEEIVVLGRSSVREDALRSAVKISRFHYRKWSLDIDFSQYQLVINTTPAGAADLLANSVHPGLSTILFDVIYKPWPTELAKRWSDCGGQVINGLELLLYQGIDQLEIVLGRPLDRAALASHLRPILEKAAR